MKNHQKRKWTKFWKILWTPYKAKQKSPQSSWVLKTEIESLDKKRKELQQKANKTLKDQVEHAGLNKLVKKKCWTRGWRGKKELIQETWGARNLERAQDMSMLKDSGEITSLRVLRHSKTIYVDFYKALYTKTVPLPES